jgi:hypothetical protein
VHFGVTRVFHFVITRGINIVSAGYVPRTGRIRNVYVIIQTEDLHLEDLVMERRITLI